MRQLYKSALIDDRNRLFKVVTDDTINLGRFVGALKFRPKILDYIYHFILARECCRRQNNIWNLIFSPVPVNDRVKRMVGVIKRNRRLVPVHQEFVQGMKRHHITHRKQIGPNIANHNFDIIADAIIYFTNPTASFVTDCLFCREIMQPNIIDIAASKCERNPLFNRNGGFCKCKTDVPRSTHEDDLVFFG